MDELDTSEDTALALDYGNNNHEVRGAIANEEIKALDLKKLPIEVSIENIDSVLANDKLKFTMLRRNGLGGSDSSVVLGVNPYTTRDELIKQKASNTLSEEEKAVGEKTAVRKGNDLEPLIIEKTSKAFNIEIFKPKDMYRYKDFPYLTMNFDGVAEENPGVYFPVEIKVVTTYGQKHYDFNKAFYNEIEGMSMTPPNYADSEINTIETKALQYGIPPYYYTQLQDEMMALNAEYGFLSVLRDSDWRIFTFYVHRDPYVQSRLITEGFKVWQEVVNLNPERAVEGM
ncbi:MAG: YqaJ viral recombinase family protein [Clostridium sp.]|nr:YqaJ viral recombinase family protein [Clostridium sp.]